MSVLVFLDDMKRYITAILVTTTLKIISSCVNYKNSS